MIATPSAPLCEQSATEPGGGMRGAKEAFSRTSGCVWMSPRQLGPTMRIPPRRTASISSACRVSPSPPTSAKPAVMTTSARTPASAHSSTTPGTTGAGTARTARSTGSPIASTEG